MGVSLQSRQKYLGPNVIFVRETPFYTKRALHKRAFCSFAEKGRASDPQDSAPSYTPDMYNCIGQL